MATEELVTEQFQFLGIDVQKEVLLKCVSLCEEYDVDAETFIEQWMAFSLNYLKGASPNLENIDLFARKEFSKRAVDRCNAHANENTRSATGTNLTVYGAPTAVQSENEVLSNYIPDAVKRERVDCDSLRSTELCPATYSPNIGSAKYASRNNSGKVVLSYGDENLLQVMSEAINPVEIMNVQITQIPNDDGDLYTKAIYGFELLHEKASTFDNHIRYISQYIMKKMGLENPTSVRHKTQTEIIVTGRIECDADARLNPKCVVLQGTWNESLSQAVSVDLDNVKQYSLFPGQVVAIRGINPRGDKFIAQEVYYNAALPVLDHNADMLNVIPGKMAILVAAGPYTTSENMSYEPLKDLITHIITYRPHVVILTGPFMESEHSSIKNNTLAETFRSFFDKLIDSLGEVHSASPYTKICIVSSPKDCFHANIYPSPPYTSRRKHANISFMPDPCTLNIHGIVIGVTSNDVLMQISKEEISLGMGGDKLSRLASHVLMQQTYYPVWPPRPGMSVDSALWAAHAQLSCTPHILVVPSNFRYFIKEVNGCVVVNPEHLTKGPGGGTFARLLISSDKSSKHIAAQILRI